MKVFGLGQVLTRRKPRPFCAVCDGLGWLNGWYVYDRDLVCTCGAGPADELTLHAGDCDSVPCPFCPLLREGVLL